MKVFFIVLYIFFSFFIYFSCGNGIESVKNKGDECLNGDCKNKENDCNNCKDFEICKNETCVLKENHCYNNDDCNNNKICKENFCISEYQEDFKTEGIYEIQGNDIFYGNYHGELEIRKSETNQYKIIHLTEFDDTFFENLKVATAWEGVLNKENLKVSVTLYKKGFITKYNGLVRNSESPYKTECSASLIKTDKGYNANFSCDDEQHNFDEVWLRKSDIGENPIWKNERIEIETHQEISQTEKEERFLLYRSFHDLDEVKPYVDRDEFKRAMHFYIYDPTDLKYYRENKDKVRVIQKIIDNISLKESKQRRDAYSMTLKEKQEIYEDELQRYFLNERGMYSDYLISSGEYKPSGDGLLWTGVYVASQSMRYLITEDNQALNNMINSLNGMLTCFYITENDNSFARTIRKHKDTAVECIGDINDDNGKWCKGRGIYSDTDYLMSGNNDMFKGYIVAFPWAYKALKKAGINEYDSKIKDVMKRLVENNNIAGDKKINEFLSYLILYMLENNFLKKREYKLRYESVWDLFVDPWLVDQGNGARYDYGTADWSGTHLNIQTLISTYIIFDTIKDDDKKQAVKLGFKRALEHMRFTNQGLFQLASSVLGEFTTPPDELFYSLWYLKSYIAPKKNINFDWSINPEFCISPYPNLPWKNDWNSQPDHRINSIRMYPNFEQNVDDYMFKSNPFSFKGKASENKMGGADFLFAYWFARYFNVIDDNE